ncbi:MFS transporter [Nocardioides sp. T2.26MG-1]|uniref:MFS transporter n=1 Tax=Nocardioides sp. T2.26MG-1 TaxID=3041166 RepID=UPI0024778717|nr:MFS transporter [Nocardioides sp. T2.26MG-1]CAI9404667.1 Multidrug resistance protein Stp [Nocardioides sp. T2.26MG-1]
MTDSTETDAPETHHETHHGEHHGAHHEVHHLGHPIEGATDAEIVAHTTAGRARLELLVVGFAALAVSLTQALLIPVLATLPATLETSASNVEWLLTSTLLVGAVAVPLFGRLGDMFGKRRMMLVALSMLVVGSLITCFTSDIALLILGRAVQGASMATIPLGISLLSATLPRERVGAAVAVISAMLGVGGALALPVASLIAEHADFHALFWITAVGGAVAIVAVLVVVPEAPTRSGGRLDLVGAVLLSATLVALLLPLAQTATWGWGSARVIGLLSLSAVLLVVFGWSQTRIREPLVDLVALRRRPIVLTNLTSILFGFALFASMIGTAGYVQAPEESGYGFGSSMLVSGLVMLPSGLMMLVFAPVAAQLIRRRGAPQTLALGAAVVALSWVIRIAFTGSIWWVVVGGVVLGVGVGVGYAAMPTLINEHTPVHELAAANGLNTLARSIGTTLASAIGGSILAAATVSLGGYELPSLTAYRELFVLCVAASTIAALLALTIPRERAATE